MQFGILMRAGGLFDVKNAIKIKSIKKRTKTKKQTAKTTRTKKNTFKGDNLATKTKFERKRLSSYDRQDIAFKQNWRCKICYKLLPPTYEIDHRQPLFKGGADDKNNMQALCRDCHGTKSMQERLGIFNQQQRSLIYRGFTHLSATACGHISSLAKHVALPLCCISIAATAWAICRRPI